jgi:hypothetical protein
MKPRSWLIAALAAAAAVAPLVVAERQVGAASGPGIVNPAAAMCMQPVDGSIAAGAEIVLEPCLDIAEQHWAQEPIAGAAGQFTFENFKSGMCLDVRGHNADRTPVQQWPCPEDGKAPVSNQRWSMAFSLSPVPIISRVSGASNHCLDDPFMSTQPGTALWIIRCNNTDAQLWEFGNG